MEQYKNNNRTDEVNQGYNRRDFLKLALAGVLSLGAASCARLERMGEIATNVGRKIKDKTWGYGAIDDYLTLENIKQGNIGEIAQGVVLYPIDWALDIGIRTPKGILYDIPKEAWNQVVNENGLTSPAHAESTAGKYVRIAVLPVTLPVGYGVVAAKGIAKQVKERPLESILHTIATAAVGKWWYDKTHRIHSHRRGAGGGGNGGGNGESGGSI